MNKRSLRVSLLLLALLIAAFLAFRGCGEEEPKPETPQPKIPNGIEFDPHGGTGAAPPVEKLDTEPVEIDPVTARRDVGDPLEVGTEVSLDLDYVAGTVSEYEITTAQSIRDRNTGATVATRIYYGVETRVVSGTADGEVRIRLSMTWFRMQAIYPNGFQFDFDSRAPDERMLDHPQSSLVLRPFKGTLDLPLEFTLGDNQGPTGVEGENAWNEAWQVAVNAVDPSASREGGPYHPDRLLTEWSELLFPPIGRGTLTAGESRDVEILQDTESRAFVQNRGLLRATHDADGTFRVTMLAKPERKTRSPRNERERAIEKTKVVSSKDAYYGAWQFDRSPARLVHAELETKYQLWTSYRMGTGQGGGQGYDPYFLDIERLTRVELVRER